MKCTDFELRLQSLLDERGALECDAELHTHALTCAECQSLVETYELLFDGLKARAAEQRVVVAASGLNSKSTNGPSPSKRAWQMAAAAAVLLAAGLAVRNWQSTNADPVVDTSLPVASRAVDLQPDPIPAMFAPAPTQPETLVSSVPVVSQVASEPAPMPDADLLEIESTLDESDAIGLSFLESPADEYAGLYRATGRGLAVMLRSMRPISTDSALVEPVREDPAGGSWRKLHRRIEPLTDSMSEALEALLRGKPATSPSAAADRAS